MMMISLPMKKLGIDKIDHIYLWHFQNCIIPFAKDIIRQASPLKWWGFLFN
jgi:hypothetical protein